MSSDGRGRGSARASAVLLYAPGQGRYPANTAGGVAEVIAATLDRRRAGHYRAEASVEPAPRGLRLGKTVHDPAGRPLLEVFQLDYRERMGDRESAAGPAPAPGVLRSAGYALWSVALLWGARRRTAKSRMAKRQLVVGLGVAIALLATAAVAAVSTLAAMDLLRWVPSWATGWLPDERFDAATVAVSTGGVTTLTWARARSGLLALAQQVRHNLRYLDEDRHRATVTQTLDDAVDGLLDDGWEVPVHLLGYSFGSLVLVDALFPFAGAAPEAERMAGVVRSLTTIGCPADTVRLYFPQHFRAARRARIPGLAWTNVFIPADVFASNFRNEDDLGKEPSVELAGVSPTSIQYTHETLSLLTILRMKGFRTHGGYWGDPGHASCFDHLVDHWVPTG